jgi:transposase
MTTPVFNISQADIEKLRYERFAYPHPLIQKRIFALWLKAELNYSNQTIGVITGLHYNTVAHWIKVYKQQGYAGLLTNHYGTNKSELEAHSDSILCSFSKEPPMYAAQAAERIHEMTGIQRSQQQVRAFMKRHGLKFLKCGHIPAKADNEGQHQWADNTLKPAIEAAQQQQIHLLFCDAAHFVLQPFLCCLWAAVRIFIPSAAGRHRINVLGAVDAITKEITTLTNTTYITADTLLQFLKQLKQKYADKPIALVLDNARYQHCELVKAFAESLKINLLFLPPYSPNLNIIERVWKFAKKKILYAKYYNKPAAFHQAIQDFFHNINQQYQPELTSLLSLKFQFFDNIHPLFYPL